MTKLLTRWGRPNQAGKLTTSVRRWPTRLDQLGTAHETGTLATMSSEIGRRSPVRLRGEDRRRLSAELADRYEHGQSLTPIANETGHSFGFVRTLLLEAEVDLRPRGGANNKTGPPTTTT